uniref:Uncharacterized protein n=1 Tax=Glossina brevipalpis TaxID=37001 RepID=A0A1A9X380_9MUSC
MFIVSGLLMFIGLITYISILKAEIGSKLRPRSTLQPPLFKVTYGQSFFLFVFGFMATEFVGLLNIFLYISLQEIGYYSRLPCFTLTSLKQKIKEGENHCNHTYKHYKKHEKERTAAATAAASSATTSTASNNERRKSNHNKRHQIHVTGRQESVSLDTKKKLKNSMHDNDVEIAFTCRKHPNGMASTMFLNELEKRYYFERPANKCNLHAHAKNLAKSMSELYNNSERLSPMVTATPPPPPPSFTTLQAKDMNHTTLPRPPEQFSDLPQEFPLTRSISTTTDIYTYSNDRLSHIAHVSENNNGRDYNRKRNVATSTRCNNIDTETQTIGSGNNNSKTNSTNFKIQQLDNNYSEERPKNRNGNATARESECENEDDEEVSQSLCGLRRGIKKTKDELFEEFCKRAGVRPKPKNIYYITGEENANTEQDARIDDIKEQRRSQKPAVVCATFRHKEGHESQRKPNIYPGGSVHLSDDVDDDVSNILIVSDIDVEDDDNEVDAINDVNVTNGNNNIVNIDVYNEEDEEENFKKFPRGGQTFHFMNDNPKYMRQGIRYNRRASMYVEPHHLKRLNSQLSLHGYYAPPVRMIQKSLYDLDNVPQDFSEPHYQECSTYGGSQSRLALDSNNQSIYQSRTLPRAFFKRNSDSQHSLHSAASLHLSAAQLNNIYNVNQNRLSAMMQQQQQFNRILAVTSRQPETYDSHVAMKKSNEELNNCYGQTQQQQQQQQQQHHSIYMQPQYQTVSVTNSYNSNRLQPPLVQWPAAIPSSPSNYTSTYRIYDPITTKIKAQVLLVKSNANK